MKSVITIIMCLLSINGFSQVILNTMPNLKYSKAINCNLKIGIGLLSYRKLNFMLNVHKNNEIVVTDDDGHTIFQQKNGKGKFHIVTNNKFRYIIIYDKSNGKFIPITEKYGNDYSTNIKFGNNRAEVIITSTDDPLH